MLLHTVRNIDASTTNVTEQVKQKSTISIGASLTLDFSHTEYKASTPFIQHSAIAIELDRDRNNFGSMDTSVAIAILLRMSITIEVCKRFGITIANSILKCVSTTNHADAHECLTLYCIKLSIF